MLQEIKQDHWIDENGNPAGGTTYGTGFCISWQNGPLGKPDDPDRKEPNGAFVEGIIEAAMGRIEFYQTGSAGRFACEENASAIVCLKAAIICLHSRTKRRIQANTEGSHEGN